MDKGFVSLVGSGPGDAELLTVKALRLIQEADVVVFDRLVSAEVLDLIPPGVSRISVGKTAGKHCVPQDQINEIIVNLALSGRRVVRLKGGDPYIFGRGGEEAQVLIQHGIDYQVVPGITAAAGCSTYNGIPLTHRGLSHGVRFMTGHFHNDQDLNINWDKIVDPDCTLVIYMGLANLQSISDELIIAGLHPTTPAAAIQGCTTESQHKIISTISDLPALVCRAKMESPVMIIVGDVVSLSNDLDWYQSNHEANKGNIGYESFDSAHA